MWGDEIQRKGICLIVLLDFLINKITKLFSEMTASWCRSPTRICRRCNWLSTILGIDRLTLLCALLAEKWVEKVGHTIDGVVEILDVHGVARWPGDVRSGPIVARVFQPCKWVVLRWCNRTHVMRVFSFSSFDHLMTLIIRLIYWELSVITYSARPNRSNISS